MKDSYDCVTNLRDLILMTKIDNKIMHLKLILFQFHVFMFDYPYWMLNLLIKVGNYSGYKCNYSGVYNDTTLNISKVIVSCKI